MNVPKLRFSEFSENYKKIKLKNMTKLITKGTTPRKYTDSGVNFIKVENLLDNQIKNINSYISYETHNNELKRSILKEYDILFSIAGALGRTAIVTKEELPANTNQACSIIRLDNLNDYNLYYLMERLHHFDIKSYINKCQSVGAQPNLSLEQVGNICINIPNKKEQDRVGRLIELVNKKIELQTKKIDALKLFKKGLLKCEYNKIKSKNLSQLNNVAQIYQPRTLSQKQLKKGVYPVFGANGIIGFNSNFNHKLPQITISCRGENSGSINKTPEYCWINGNSMVINVDNNPNINKDYLKLILESQNLKYLISGSGQPQIIRSDIAKHKIPIISIDEQLIYIKKFNLLESKLPLEISKLKKLNLLKKGLMQNMFI